MNQRRLDWDEDRIKSNFEIDDLDGYELVYSADNSPPYETDFWALLRKDGKLYEIRCSTCSCYGCEGQFDPRETTLEEVKVNMDHDEWSAVYDYLL